MSAFLIDLDVFKVLVAVDVAIIGVDIKNLVGASLVTNSILSVGFFL